MWRQPTLDESISRAARRASMYKYCSPDVRRDVITGEGGTARLRRQLLVAKRSALARPRLRTGDRPIFVRCHGLFPGIRATEAATASWCGTGQKIAMTTARGFMLRGRPLGKAAAGPGSPIA